ncbi:hypothetical protein HOS86_gp093 [Klebsiella phage vB_KpnM_KpS110]|uniref:Transmembrane protein n=2 Tax=Taipeivirus TaxID=2731621 RepID=A0A5Q2F2N2_9CAUD|nr:hypothetical protein HOS86_gp093 [Klebsiella phage vB_KpnM_KpS110]YP_009884708.1 hypothetical protein HYQ02_gp114 [Klebsiella phage UPM 2146]EGJ6623190.1 hypothetical protein [Salmonella enterica]UJD04913.1 hypothetical protein PWKp5_00170 [Klebsiella phage PWKp5]UPW36187.1 hypothetical protein K751_00181 [Klebsiella phage K751]URG13743.1 hypothetical protein T751_00186 [Klebsiella phage T751]URG17862.1 hypothetical protein T765_00023 [Klebsiella phage T765]WJJ58792.1 hypothetical protein
MNSKWLDAILLVGAITCLASLLTMIVYHYGFIDLSEAEKKTMNVVYWFGFLSFFIPVVYKLFLKEMK